MPRFRRYQLRKAAAGIVSHGHPWIFRDQLSSAAAVFRDGDWLRLVDGANRVVGYGCFEREGAIAIRVLRTGDAPPDAPWFVDRLARAIARRAPLAERTTGIRLLHGESDGVPAVVIDRFGDVAVVASYATGTDVIARLLAHHVTRIVPELARVQWRPAHRRRGTAPPPRMLRGTGELAHFVEDGLAFAVDLDAGQKTGTFLDLRGLRHLLAGGPLAGARVLDLFAYTGMLGRAAIAGGAAHVTHVDASERALAFAAAHHAPEEDAASRHAYVTADIFEWLPTLDPAARFDLVIVDPPSMTSSKAQVPAALAAYRRLYRAAARHVVPGGAIVAACCTSRIERRVFHRTVGEALGAVFTRERELLPELDHPVGFPQADYLKIAVWRRGPDL